MAQFTVQCPHCKQQFIGQTEWFGQQANCPICRRVFTIQGNSYSTENVSISPQASATYSESKGITPKLLWITGGAVSLGICLCIFLFFLFSHLFSSNNIPILPKFDEKYSFSWKNASIDKIRKSNKEIISDKESEGEQYIDAVGKDGVTRMFQFDSTKHLTSIMCKIDITDSAKIMVKLNEKYKKNEKPTTSDDGKYMVMIWRDKDSNTEIKIVTFTSNLQTFIMLKQLSE